MNMSPLLSEDLLKILMVCVIVSDLPLAMHAGLFV